MESKIKKLSVREILSSFFPVNAECLYDVPYYKPTEGEESYLKYSCLDIFPFDPIEMEIIKRVFGIAVGIFSHKEGKGYIIPFIGSVFKPNALYVRSARMKDFVDPLFLDEVSVLFGFCTYPDAGPLPSGVEIEFRCSKIVTPTPLVFGLRRFFWDSKLLVAKLPTAYVKTGENGPFTIRFYPEDNYEHIKPVGVTFSMRGY
jgi:hypothetical protein